MLWLNNKLPFVYIAKILIVKKYLKCGRARYEKNMCVCVCVRVCVVTTW